MLTTTNPQYGNFVVMKMYISEYNGIFYSTTGKKKYGVFKINPTANNNDPSITDPRKAYKVELEPIGCSDFVRRDWYSDILIFNEQNSGCQVFDNYFEALNWANDMNIIVES